MHRDGKEQVGSIRNQSSILPSEPYYIYYFVQFTEDKRLEKLEERKKKFQKDISRQFK